jgi:hypothetical protein
MKGNIKNKREIVDYISKIEKAELDFKQNKTTQPLKTKSWILIRLLNNFRLVFLSSIDFLILIISKKRRGGDFLFLAKNFTVNESSGKLVFRLPYPKFDKNTVLINHSKIDHISSINNLKVFNLGPLILMISAFLPKKKQRFIQHFFAYKILNDLLIYIKKPKSVSTLCFYDMNGLSLVFSKYRGEFELIEIQHGSIVNYPPYLEPCIIKPADTFYVKNSETIAFIKANLAKNFQCNYELIKYPEVIRKKKSGINILYASTIEFNGFHPLFVKFLNEQTLKDLNLIIRLHPREREKEDIFRSFISKFDVKFEFDTSKNWLESNVIENLFVVSPWSSTIEDAYDNGYISIIIDPVGKDRYSHLINGKSCIYSDDLIKTLTELTD